MSFELTSVTERLEEAEGAGGAQVPFIFQKIKLFKQNLIILKYFIFYFSLKFLQFLFFSTIFHTFLFKLLSSTHTIFPPFPNILFHPFFTTHVNPFTTYFHPS